MLTASLYSPLEKFLLGRPVEAQPYTKASCLGGEEFAFQVVLQRDGWDVTPVQVEAASPLGGEQINRDSDRTLGEIVIADNTVA